MKKLIITLALLACSTDPSTTDSLVGAGGNGADAQAGDSAVHIQPPAQGGRGGTTLPPPGVDGGPTAYDLSPSPTVDATPATDLGAGGSGVGFDAGPAPDSMAAGMDASVKVDVGGSDARGSKLTVVVQPGASFTGDVAKITAALEKRCEGMGNGDGRACEVGVAGLGFVAGKCWSHFCCPGCWDGATCRLTITTKTTNSSVDDVACGAHGSMCHTCEAPQTCKQMTVPGDVVVTGCQN